MDNIPKEIFLQIIDYLPINEQLKLKIFKKKWITEKFEDYGFMLITGYDNSYPIFFTRYKNIVKYVYKKYNKKKYKTKIKSKKERYDEIIKYCGFDKEEIKKYYEENLKRDMENHKRNKLLISFISGGRSCSSMQLVISGSIYYKKWGKKERNKFFKKRITKKFHFPTKFII